MCYPRHSAISTGPEQQPNAAHPDIPSSAQPQPDLNQMSTSPLLSMPAPADGISAGSDTSLGPLHVTSPFPGGKLFRGMKQEWQLTDSTACMQSALQLLVQDSRVFCMHFHLQKLCCVALP